MIDFLHLGARSAAILAGAAVSCALLVGAGAAPVDEATVPGIKTLSGSVSWNPSPKFPPYGYGNFSAVVSLATPLTNLNQISKSQDKYFYQGTWQGLGVWEERLTKDDGKKRSYKFEGYHENIKFKYLVSFSLSKDKLLTISAKGTNRGYVSNMFLLRDIDSIGTNNLTYTVLLKNDAGGTVVTVNYPARMYYANYAGQKSITKKMKD